MKEYDLIVVGTGSAMNLVDPMIQENPEIRIAVIDKDDPGGICLTRGCIPSKLLLYPAELVRTIEAGEGLGVSAVVKVDFERVMNRMRTMIETDIESIREGLSTSPNIDYYRASAEFVSPYTMSVSGETITSRQIFICSGSRTTIPPIINLEKVGYLTSDTVLKLSKLPASVSIVGGGYIAAEYGHFFSCMGAAVTIIGRNPQFLPGYEPEISLVARRALEKHMTIVTDREVVEAETRGGLKVLRARDRSSGTYAEFAAEEVLIASGRQSMSDLLHPERSGIRTDRDGWIEVDEHLQTSQPNIWALGDADGKYLFKHVANYESQVVYRNAVLKSPLAVDYHAVPHAVFTYPEVAGVGVNEREAISKYGEADVLIGFYQYENTAKGEAMGAKDYFVKALVQRTGERVLGAQIVGPYASVLIQEVIDAMNTPGQSVSSIRRSMHIHPAMTEVVERAFLSLSEPSEYHHMLGHLGLEPLAERAHE
jgi:mycothione reductase